MAKPVSSPSPLHSSHHAHPASARSHPPSSSSSPAFEREAELIHPVNANANSLNNNSMMNCHDTIEYARISSSPFFASFIFCM
ncbi:hypothetical protein HYDPIDRAFT_117267 [Hydnomerulius pinastri MD-312]|uniref:Uncharacterized protein n=1 Tax=Hydnomerulius pinastri MD-312 TaxID=994086 RepID=A0A0C9V4F9_9AGAM|nr:hypothetical protein HYDPIDRAFT_117267 [Hydnomerulius pinastri MD-312]